MRPMAIVPALVVSLLLATTCLAASGDELWSSEFALRGTNGTVEAMVEFNGDLILAGDFTEAGSQPFDRVVRWDGSSFSSMGDGFDDDVLDLQIWNNELYACGFFSQSGATPIGSLAKWTGTTWIEVGGGVDLAPKCMTVYNGDLIVGGDFISVGSGAGAVSSDGVASWDGTSWTDLNSGFSDFESGSVAALEVYNGQLYAGGFFLSASGSKRKGGGGPVGGGHIARYLGSVWQIVGGGVSSFGDGYGGEVNDLAVFGGKLIVGGLFDETGTSQGHDGVAGWNGSFWSDEGPLFGENALRALGVADGQLFAADFSGRVFRKNGPSWAFLFQSDITKEVREFGTWGTDLVLGGEFLRLGSSGMSHVALYDGSQLSAVGSGQGLDDFTDHLMLWNGSLVAGGGFNSAGGAEGSGKVAAWDGTGWTGFNGGIVSNFDSPAALGTFQGDLVVGGQFTSIGGVSAKNVASWNGTAWSPFGGGSVTNVTAVYEWNGSLYAHMDLSGSTGSIARWDGASWIVEGADTGGGDAVVMVEYGGELIVAGQFNTIAGVTVNHIARYDGTNWASLGGGVSGVAVNRVFDMVVHDGLLYIVGEFAQAGGVSASHMAVWNGSSWSEFAGGLNGSRGRAITVFSDEIFVTGGFTAAGSVPAANIARYDGTTWHALGSGLDGPGAAIRAYQGRVYVSGGFRTAGGSVSERIASWGPAATAVETRGSRLALLPSAPNPFGARTSISYELPGSAQVEIEIHDLRGRRVARASQGLRAAGRHVFQWDGRDHGGRTVANGAYFIVLRAGSEVRRSRVTVIR